jgi:hypothetical protein
MTSQTFNFNRRPRAGPERRSQRVGATEYRQPSIGRIAGSAPASPRRAKRADAICIAQQCELWQPTWLAAAIHHQHQKPHSGPKRGGVFRASLPAQHRHRSRCHLPPLTSSFSCISRSAHAIRAASAAWRADRSAASCARSCSVVTRRPRGGGPGVAGGAHDRSSGGIVIGCTAHAANSSSSQARRISGAGSGWQRSSYGGFFRASPTNRQARECVHTIAGWKPDQPRSLADQKASQVMFHTLIPKRITWISVD